MFKSAKWRSEKNKIKAVFKLQFHATQVLQSGVDTLALSLVPVDVGKPSVRLQSTKVKDGSCRWENPVCEYVKFIQEAKTGKITEKFYHFVVSTGSHKKGLFGEVSLNFADYAETTKPSSVSLPLNSSHNNAVLHVLIQKLPEKVDERELEDCDGAKRKSQDMSLQACLGIDGLDKSNQSIAAEDTSSRAITYAVGFNSACRSSSGSEMTRSSSESTSGLDTAREICLRNSTIHQDTSGLLSPLRKHSEFNRIDLNVPTSPIEEHQKPQWDWSAGLDHGPSADNSANSFHGVLMRERSGKASDSQIDKLNAEIAILVRQVDISELELQTLRKQIAKESKRAQDLSKDVVALREERDNHKSECERLRSFQTRMEETKARNKSQFVSGDLRTLTEEIREELHYEKERNANLIIQLQKTQESNAELMLAVRDLDEMLEQKNKEISNLSNKLESKEDASELRDDEEQKALEKLVRAHSNVKETYFLERKIIDLYSEIEIYRRDKDELEMQMEQLALDYEILKQENHDIAYKLEQSQLQEQLNMQYEYSSPASAENDLESRIVSLENELRIKSGDFSYSLATIKELETRVKALEEELDMQAQGFAADLESLTLVKVEQEQRAIRAEEALRQTRSKNASTAERLQEEFRRFSMQMASTFDANEMVTMKAMTEANELRAQKNQLEEILGEVKEELHSVNIDYEVRLHVLSCQIDTMAHQMKDMLLEIEEKSKQLESQTKHEKEVHKSYSDEIEMLKAKIQSLEVELLCLTEQIEQNEKLKLDLESMRQSVEEANASMQRGNELRNELVKTMAMFKKETHKAAMELNRVKHTNDEKERIVKFQTSELENLRVESSDLKTALFENEIEKEKLWKLVVQLKDDLNRKDNSFSNNERKFKDSNGRAVLSGETKTNPKNKKNSIAQTPKEVSSLRDEIEMLEDLIKLKETALESSSSSFLEKEKENQHKIEELESRIEKLSQSCPFQLIIEEESITASNDDTHATVASATEFITSTTTCSTTQNEDIASQEIRTDGSLTEQNGAMTKHGDDSFGDIMTELASLKEKNKEMESELKEMQERYSEISLKFAEVEGERQRLMMTVRTLKNARKSS